MTLSKRGLDDDHCGILKDLVIDEDERIYDAADQYVNDGDEDVFLDWMLHLCGVRGDENEDVEVEEVQMEEVEVERDDLAAATANQEQMSQLMMEVQRQKKELQDKMEHVQQQLSQLRSAKDYLAAHQQEDGEDDEDDEYEDDFEEDGSRKEDDDEYDDDDYEDDESNDELGDSREDDVIQSQSPPTAPPQAHHRRLSLTKADTADAI